MTDREQASFASLIYLDHQATTPVDPRVAEVMADVLINVPGNPNSSGHYAGRRAALTLDRARECVASLSGCEPRDVHFTSGASDAIRKALVLATSSSTRRHVAAMPVEHPAVIDATSRLASEDRIDLTWLVVDARGQLNFDSLEQALLDGADLVCLMMANNEVGTIYPLSDVAEACRCHGAELLIDATQAGAWLDLSDASACSDFLILSGHKMYGPKGVGALITPDRGQNALNGLGHAGTPDTAGIAGFGKAAELALIERERDSLRCLRLRDRLQAGLAERIDGLSVNGDLSSRLPHSLHVSIAGVANEAVLARVGGSLAISTGAACAWGAQEPSHVLRAMGLADDLVDSALRMSVGRFTTEDEIDRAVDLIISAVAQIRRFGEEKIAC